MIYDETTGDYTARYGPNSVKKNQENAEPYVVVKDGQNPYVDPFKKKELEKKLHKVKQSL